MNFREAYCTLILGRLGRDYGEAWEKIRQNVLWNDYDTAVTQHGLSSEDADRLWSASRVKDSIEPSYTNGLRTYRSVFEMLLFEEATLLFGGWQHMANGFRGHLDAGWTLSPTIARTGDADADASATLRMARVLLADSSPVRHLPAVKLLGVLQHYGFVTPLLDFSTDIRVAAAFSCRGYLENPAVPMGCLIKAHAAAFEQFATQPGTALGERLAFTVDEVPRIRNQKGIFFIDFKVGFLETLTFVERCYFKHGPDSEILGATVGLPEEVLFPPDDSILHYIEANRGAGMARGLAGSALPDSREQVAEEIEHLIRRGYAACTSPSTTDDYLRLSKGWINWELLSTSQQREIEVFVRWFARLKAMNELNLPASCLTFTRLRHSVETIARFNERAEDATDIFTRLKLHGQEGMIPVLQHLLQKARAEGPVPEPVRQPDEKQGDRPDCFGLQVTRR